MAFYLNICRDHAILETSYFYSCTGNSRINRSGTETWARCKPGLLDIRMGPGRFIDNSDYGSYRYQVEDTWTFPGIKKGWHHGKPPSLYGMEVFIYLNRKQNFMERQANNMSNSKKRILTGDRPTGALHLGHYVGSVANRVKLQEQYDSYIIIADVQALTTHWEKEEGLVDSVYQITTDYLAAGIDPNKSTIFIQSMIPEIHELAMYFSMYTSVNVLRHNPTIKTEAAQHGLKDMTYGFLGYPVSQAADIAIFKANLVPVGEDQIPHIELARKIVRRFNDLYKPVLVEPETLVGDTPRLVGLDGKAKMSKSLNNAIFLSDSAEEVTQKVRNAVTDPARIHKTDPGHPEICTVYEYHKVFNHDEVDEIETQCRQGEIGCVACKKRLATTINNILEPMRERRQQYQDKSLVTDILKAGTQKAHQVARETMEEVRDALQINYFPRNQ